MSKTRSKNPNWKRSTTASRRAERFTSSAILNQSLRIVCGSGTYDIGRNASKRTDRQADIRQRVEFRRNRPAA